MTSETKLNSRCPIRGNFDHIFGIETITFSRIFELLKLITFIFLPLLLCIRNYKLVIIRLYHTIIFYKNMNLINRCKQFRKILSEDCIMTPGAYNGLTARLAVKHGFKALYVSGAAVTGSSGVPDIGLRTLN